MTPSHNPALDEPVHALVRFGPLRPTAVALACVLTLGCLPMAWAGGAGGGGGGSPQTALGGGGGGGGHGSSGGNAGGWVPPAGSGAGSGGVEGAGGIHTGNGTDGMGAPPDLRGGPGGLSSYDLPDTASAPGAAGGILSDGGAGSAYLYSGGGGGGGADGRDCAAGVQTGYAGGAGASVSAALGGAGGGGGGGAGAHIFTNAATCSVGTVTGGAGGAGGSSATGPAGGGGGGGSGLFVSASNAVVTLTGATGGNGGPSGSGVGVPPSEAGGPGTGITVTGSGNTIVASGTIAPGAVGGYTASAVDFGSAGGNTLDLNGASVNGTVRMAATDKLRGTGTLGSLLASGITIAPGHSIGTLTMGFADLRASTYNAEIDASAGTADLIDVTGPSVPPGGSAWINGAVVNISNLAGTLAVGQTYTLLRAVSGGVTGTASLGTLPAGVTATLTYPGSTSVVLTITGVAPLPPAPGGAASIPTLSEWGVAALSLLLAGGMLWQRRRGRV